MRAVLITFLIACLPFLCLAQTGNVLETGDSVLDPDGDGFVSDTDTGFSTDGYDVDEFEIKMFGVPIFGDGEAAGDVQAGPECGVTDLALDTAGYAIYAAYDENENLIFRFRLAGTRPSVQSYTILIDTDNALGNEDPNSSSENPGFEIDITLIHKFGVFVYDIDGIASCPTPLREYDVSTNQQKSVAGSEVCEDPDYFVDFYVPFSDLELLFGITPDTELRFAGVTNISATCALDGKISDIGGVNDDDYLGCFECAILDLGENQCPSGVSNLCDTCAGFPVGVTETPTINLPVLVGDQSIDGTSEENAVITIAVYSQDDNLKDSDAVNSDGTGNWISNVLSTPLDFGDSIVVNALLPGKCQSGLNDAGLSFAIVSPNQPPSLSATLSTLSYVENSSPVGLFPDLIVIDDNSELTGATLAISTNLEVGIDLIEFTLSGNISGSYDPPSGVLSLTGLETTNIYQEVLRTVSFHNTSEDPSTAIRSVNLMVNDGVNQSNQLGRNLIVIPVNDPPVVIDETMNPADTIFIDAQEEVPIQICLDANDVDSDAFNLEDFVVLNGKGTVEYSGGLCFLFIPNLDESGQEIVTVEVCDDEPAPQCDEVVVIIDIEDINDPPVIIDAQTLAEIDSAIFKTEKNQDLEFCLSGFDIEGHAIHVSQISFEDPVTSILISEGSLCFSYSPATDFVGEEVFQVTICDNGNPEACSVIVITIEVLFSNSAPVIAFDTLHVSTNKNQSLEICIDATDPDGDSVGLTNISNELPNAAITSSNLCIDYTPPANVVDVDYLEVTVCDDVNPARCDLAIVEVTILPVNNPPVVIDEQIPVDTVYFETAEDTPLPFCLETLDADGNVVIISDITLVDTSAGTITLTDNTCAEFTPGPGVDGEVVIEGTLCDDGDPLACSEFVIIIEVFPVNRPPEVVENSIAVDTIFLETQANQPLDFCLDVDDFENDPVFVEDVLTIESGGFYQPQGNLCVEFTPAQDFLGQDVHVITVCDEGDPRGCDEVVIVIDVFSTNNPPNLLIDGNPTDTLTFQIISGEELEICLDLLDPENDNISITPDFLNASNGDLEIGQDPHCLSYVSNLGFEGTESIFLEFCDDGLPTECNNAILIIEVLPPPVEANNPPFFVVDGLPADTIRFTTFVNISAELCLEVDDPDGNLVTLTPDSTDPELGFAQISEPGALCLDYTPPVDYLGLDYIYPNICDDGSPTACGFAVVEISVVSNNSAPEILDGTSPADTLIFSLNVNSVLNLCLIGVDNDGDDLHLDRGDVIPAFGDISEFDALCFSYSPELNFLGMDWFDIQMCDSGIPSLCDRVVIGVNVSSNNTAPRMLIQGVQSDTVRLTTLENETINLQIDLEDDQGDELTIERQSLTRGAGALTLDLASSIHLTYTPDANVDDLHLIDLMVCDTGFPVLCDSLVVAVSVNELNTPPVAVNDTFNVVYPETLTANILENDFDVDGDLLILLMETIQSPQTGDFEILQDGSFSYKPDPFFDGEITLEYSIRDDRPDSQTSSASVVITVETPDRSIQPTEALSPNGDNLNDVWIINGIEFFPNNTVQIFDRWNNRVFEIRGYDNINAVWGGQANRGLGKRDVPEGNYFFVIVPGDDSPRISGMVVLKR